MGRKVSAVASSLSGMGSAALLDEIAACERRVRGAEARQLELGSAFADVERDGEEPWSCEQTERAIAMEVAAALGVSLATGRDRVGDAGALTERLPAVLAALRDGRIGMFAARQVAAASCSVAAGLLTAD